MLFKAPSNPAGPWYLTVDGAHTPFAHFLLFFFRSPKWFWDLFAANHTSCRFLSVGSWAVPNLQEVSNRDRRKRSWIWRAPGRKFCLFSQLLINDFVDFWRKHATKIMPHFERYTSIHTNTHRHDLFNCLYGRRSAALGRVGTEGTKYRSSRSCIILHLLRKVLDGCFFGFVLQNNNHTSGRLK